MKKNSSYNIEGDTYVFNNKRLKKYIQRQNPNRGAFEQFYRKVVSQNVGISYDAVKGWVKKDTNPALEDVDILSKILGIDRMQLLDRTDISVENVGKLQKLTIEGVMDSFSLRYNGFSNVFDMIIGMGYNTDSGECKDSDFAERIINLVGWDKTKEYELPELLGYRFIYSHDELANMTDEELENAICCGYVDDEGNRFYDDKMKIALDRKTFGEKLLQNSTWLDDDDKKELSDIIREVDAWWDICDMPFALLKIDINAWGKLIARFTYGQGWSNPTHVDRWKLVLDVLAYLETNIELSGLCKVEKMHINQFESEMFLTIELIDDHDDEDLCGDLA